MIALSMGQSNTKSTETAAEKTPVGPAIGPDTTSRYSRIDCYKARDQFFACLDEEEFADQGDLLVCKGLEEKYNSKCLPSWVKYFNERRQMKRIPLERQIDGKCTCGG